MREDVADVAVRACIIEKKHTPSTRVFGTNINFFSFMLAQPCPSPKPCYTVTGHLTILDMHMHLNQALTNTKLIYVKEIKMYPDQFHSILVPYFSINAKYILV